MKDLHTKKMFARGKLENGLYRFPVSNNKKLAYVGVHKSSAFHSHTFRPVDNKVELWHHRLGHVVTEIVTRIMQSCNVSCGKNKATVCFIICSSCQLAKIHRLPTHLLFSRASKPLELVHTDILGPASVKATSGAKYFILFLDDYSRYTWFYPLKQRIKLFLSLSSSNFKSRINLMLESNVYSLIIVVSPGPLWIFFSNLAYFIAFLTLTTQLRIGELRGSTGMLLNLGWPCWLMPPYQ